MEAKCYRAMRRAQGKMLREYFSGVSVESLSRRYGYSVIKIKTMASDYKQCVVLKWLNCRSHSRVGFTGYCLEMFSRMSVSAWMFFIL